MKQKASVLFEDMRAVADGLENSDFDMEWSRSDAVGYRIKGRTKFLKQKIIRTRLGKEQEK